MRENVPIAKRPLDTTDIIGSNNLPSLWPDLIASLFEGRVVWYPLTMDV